MPEHSDAPQIPGWHPLRPFLSSHATAAGLTKRDLAKPAFRTIFRGVHIDDRVPDTLVVRATAALLVCPPDAVLSHFTAARLWAPSATHTSAIHVSFARDLHIVRDHLKVHRFTYPLHRARSHGLPVTGPEMTFMHLAVHLDLVELVVLGDRLVKRGRTTPEHLVAYAESWQHQGRRAGLAAARLVRSGSMAITETHLRLLIVLAGLPEPVVDHVISDPVTGEVLFRLDLAYPLLMIAIEYDGQWHDEPSQQAYDQWRRARLVALGWRFVIVRKEGVYETPEQTLAEVAVAIEERGGGAPGILRSDFRRHFGLRPAS